MSKSGNSEFHFPPNLWEIVAIGSTASYHAPTCVHAWTIAYDLWTNGALAFYRVCLRCDHYDPEALAHDVVRAHAKDAGVALLDLPHVTRLNALSRVAPPPCERCGAATVELHHWAPGALFVDAWLWPTSYLCRPCHRRWHDTMEHAGLVLRRNVVEA
jgi:hypothetical protein